MEKVGNDIKSIVKIYTKEIVQARQEKTSEFDEYMADLTLSSLPIAMFINLYKHFNDGKMGARLNSLFIEEFSYLVVSDELSEILLKMVQDLSLQISLKGTDSFSSFYQKTIEKNLTNEESIWIKNYTNAIANIYTKYKQTAAELKFIN